MHQPVPFNKPCLTGRELDYMAEAIRSGHAASGGSFTRRAEAILNEWHNAEDILLTTSCTDALEMSALLIGIEPGDVVIVPSFTFTTTALAFVRQGARLRFCDIERDNLGLDPEHVARSIDGNVKAIVTVHYAGVPCSVDELLKLSEQHDLALIEDNAHGLFATHYGQALGTFGRISTLSFHETKNFSCGEGGALVLNDAADIDRAHVLLDKGTNRRQFLDGLVDKYSWQGMGSSFGISDILAAFLTAQLESADQIRKSRRAVAEAYRTLLEPFVEELGIALPYEPATATPADHMFYVILPSAEMRPDVVKTLLATGIQATFHYVPLHTSPAGLEYADRYQACPITDDVSGRLLRLPFYNDLTSEDVLYVAEAFVSAVRKSSY